MIKKIRKNYIKMPIIYRMSYLFNFLKFASLRIKKCKKSFNKFKPWVSKLRVSRQEGLQIKV